MEKYSPLHKDELSYIRSFLDKRSSTGSENDTLEENKTLALRQQSWLRRHIRATAFHSLLILANLLFCLTYSDWNFTRYSYGPQHAYSLARDVIKYESRQFEMRAIYLPNGTLNPEKPTSFNGDPRVELDEAWHNLIQHQNIHVHKDELGEFADDSSIVQLSDGSGYWTGMAVFHGLHCVERLHHFIHRDFYYADILEDDARRLIHHTEHCLDYLRQYVQCNADTTLIPLHWVDDQALAVARNDGMHQCVVWDGIEHWMEERSFDTLEPGLLVYPKYGNLFGGNRKGDKIGIAVKHR